MNPAGGQAGMEADHAGRQLQTVGPLFGMGEDLPVQLQDGRMCLLFRSDTGELGDGLGRVAQFQPAFGGGQMMAVWRFERGGLDGGWVHAGSSDGQGA